MRPLSLSTKMPPPSPRLSLLCLGYRVIFLFALAANPSSLAFLSTLFFLKTCKAWSHEREDWTLLPPTGTGGLFSLLLTSGPGPFVSPAPAALFYSPPFLSTSTTRSAPGSFPGSVNRASPPPSHPEKKARRFSLFCLVPKVF